jgi:hypothetical protein
VPEQEHWPTRMLPTGVLKHPFDIVEVVIESPDGDP